VEVEFLKFEASSTGGAELEARWTVRGGPERAPLRTGELRRSRRAEAEGTEATVAALSALLADLADAVAGAVQEVN
jgi:uncharacterized lipoprotein YmbA